MKEGSKEISSMAFLVLKFDEGTTLSEVMLKTQEQDLTTSQHAQVK
jgi:hypothetical protein